MISILSFGALSFPDSSPLRALGQLSQVHPEQSTTPTQPGKPALVNLSWIILRSFFCWPTQVLRGEAIIRAFTELHQLHICSWLLEAEVLINSVRTGAVGKLS